MKAKPLHPTLADRCAEMLADMRREHPDAVLEWAVAPGMKLLPIYEACDCKVFMAIDTSLKYGQVFLRIRWS